MAELSKKEIVSQLERILVGPEIKGGTKIGQFLSYVTGQTLDGSQNDLNQYKIGVEALNYPVDFDPQNNPMVRIHAGRLRRALTSYYAQQGADDPIRIDIPKGSYAPVFSRNRSSTRRKESAFPKDLSTPSIGVMLFRSLHDVEELDYIASGITEELIISLTRFSNFRVIGPLFREVVRKKNLDLYDIGKTYKIRFLLEGTIRKREESLHITVKLIDTLSGENIWGETIKCNVLKGSLAACEEHIVNSIAGTIGDNFGVMNTVLSKDALNGKTLSSSSYEAVLRFYHYIMVFTEKSYIEALNALENAVQQDHNDAFCLAALGDILITSYFAGYDEDGSVVDRVEELGRQSVALDPNCQQSRFTMAMFYFARSQKMQFISEASRVLRINPNNANLTAALGMHLWMIGEYDQGKKLMEEAIALNPHHPGWFSIVSYCHHYRNGEFVKALADAQNINLPELYIDPLFRAAAYGQCNDVNGGKAAINELLALSPNFRNSGRDIIKRLFYLDEHVDMLWDGLEKAGLEVSR